MSHQLGIEHGGYRIDEHLDLNSHQEAELDLCQVNVRSRRHVVELKMDRQPDRLVGNHEEPCLRKME